MGPWGRAHPGQRLWRERIRPRAMLPPVTCSFCPWETEAPVKAGAVRARNGGLDTRVGVANGLGLAEGPLGPGMVGNMPVA